MEPLNNIDVVILIGVVLSMLVAFIRGFVKEVLSILGLALFIILTTYLTPVLTPWMNQFIASKLMAQFVIFLVIMAIFYAFWIIGTDNLIAKIRTSTLSFMDRLFGLIFGLIRAVLILGFIFLIVKIVLPEEIKDKDGILRKSQYFMMAESCSDMIESLLPEDFIKNTMKSVEEINKTEKKTDKKDTKENKKEDEKTAQSKETGLPSELDQKQMDKMFDLLVKPEIKSSSKQEKTKSTGKINEKTGYDKKETNSLDRLIDITAE